MIDILIKLAKDLDKKGLEKEANYLDSIIQKMAEKKAKPKKGAFIFSSDDPKVLDNKDHFSIETLEQALHVLSRVNSYKEAPSWYDGSLESLLKKVVKVIQSKHEDLKVSEEAPQPKPKTGG